MRLSINSLRRLVLEEISKENKLQSRKRRQRREQRLVENALRLLEGDNEEQDVYDPGDGKAQSQADAAGMSSLPNLEINTIADIPKEILKQANDQLEGANGQGDGGVASKINQDKALAPTVKWLNTFLDEKKNPAGKEVAHAVHYILGHGSQDGQNDQKIKRSDVQTPAAGTLIPTQGEIDLFKSIGHPLTNPKSFMDCYTGDPHGKGKNIVIAGNFVLDGHHRWSTIACILGKGAPVRAVNFDVPHINKEAGEQILAVSQVAIVGDTDYGKLQRGSNMVPLATTSEVKDSDGNVITTNILGNKNNLLTILSLIEQGKNDLMDYDPHAKNYVETKILGEPYLDYAIFDNKGPFDDVSGFSAQFIKQYGLDSVKPSGKNSIGECSPEEISAIRSKIVQGLITNWGQCKISGAGKPPRNLMPQFDGGETHGGKYGEGENQKKYVDDTEIFNHMAAGETNFKSQYVDPKLTESIDLARWNKLAGILKD